MSSSWPQSAPLGQQLLDPEVDPERCWTAVQPESEDLTLGVWSNRGAWSQQDWLQLPSSEQTKERWTLNRERGQRWRQRLVNWFKYSIYCQWLSQYLELWMRKFNSWTRCFQRTKSHRESVWFSILKLELVINNVSECRLYQIKCSLFFWLID